MRQLGAPVITLRGKTATAASVTEHFAPSPAGPREKDMSALIATPLVHYYDTRERSIPCGVRGFEDPSTKHSRSVTCPACLEFLGERPTTASSSASAASADLVG
jgi:hypothetical protein